MKQKLTRNIILKIVNPCQENWEIMDWEEKGRFCQNCQKTVIDFSRKTDEEIFDFFAQKANNQRVCGRFKNTQLNRSIEIKSKLEDWYWQVELNYTESLFKRILICVLSGLLLISCESKTSKIAVKKPNIEKDISKSKLEFDYTIHSIHKNSLDKSIEIEKMNQISNHPPVEMPEIVDVMGDLEIDLSDSISLALDSLLIQKDSIRVK